VEAQHRSLRSADPSGEALNANVSQMLQDPETWRAEKFHYFRPDASNSERMDGHRKMKAEASTYNKSESFQSTFGFQDDVTIRKRHYWKWLCQFESIDEPTALRQFDNFHMVQGNKHDFNKEEAIKVSHPLKIDRGGKGHKTTTGTTQADACSDEVHRAFTQKCQRAMEGEDSDGSSAGELDERDFPSTKFFQETSSSIDGQSNSTKAIPSTLSAGCSSEWASTLTMGGSEPWPDKRKKGTTTPPTTPSAKGSKKSDPPEGTTRVTPVLPQPLPQVEDGEEMDGVVFLNAKKTLKACTAELTNRLSGPGGMMKGLGKKNTQLQKYQETDDDCPYRTADLLQDCTELANKLAPFSEKVKACKLQDYSELKKEFDQFHAKVNAMQKKYDNQTAALSTKMTETIQEYKSNYATQYWIVKAYYDCLIATTHGAGWSKFFAAVKFDRKGELEVPGVLHGKVVVNPKSPAEFFTTLVTIFRGGEGTLCEKLRGFFSSQRAAFDEKKKGLLSFMAENKDSPGCSGHVKAFQWDESHECFFEALPARRVFESGKGGLPWMRAFSHNSKNFGPGLGMGVGMACIIWTYDKELTLVLIPLDPFVEKGITPDTYESHYWEEKADTVLLKKHSVMVELGPYDMLYVPVGWIWHAYTYERRPKDAVKSWKPGVSTFCHVPLRLPFENVSDVAKLAIKDWNHGTFRVKPQTMWKDRANFFTTVLTS
jgi:hypothetical protein